MRRPMFVLAVLLAGAAILGAQQQPQQAPVFRAGVELVTLEVIVVDKAGMPIRGLTADDFVVTLEGKTRAVRAIDFLEYAAPPATDAPAGGVSREVTNQQTNADRGGRVFLIVFDDLSAKLMQAKFLTLAAERMLATLDDDDLVGLVTTSALGPVVQPTRDRDALLKALRSKTLIGRNDDDPFPRFYIGVNEAIDIFNGVVGTLKAVIERECGIRNYNPVQTISNQCPHQIESDARHLGALTVHRTASQMAAYRAAIAALARAPKPRIVIALSYGVATSPVDNLKEQTDSIARAAAESSTQFYSLVEAVPEFDMSTGKPGLELAQREEKAFLNSGAQIVATAAGGEAFLVVGQADRFFTRIQRETSGFYRLGVEAPIGTDRQRILTAKVTARRPGVTVRTNSHAILDAVAAEAISADERARMALAQGGASFGVPLAIGTAVRRDPAPSARLQLAISVQVPAIVPGPLIAMFALLNNAGAVVRNGQTRMPPADASGHHAMTLPVPVDPGRYRLRVVVADANGNVGSLEQPIAASLAHFGGFTVSEIFTGWAAEDGVLRFLVFESVPASAATVRASVELYPDNAANPPDVTVHLAIVPSGSDTAILERDVTPTGTGAARTASISVPVDLLPPGTYELRATMIEAGAVTGTVTRLLRLKPSGGG